MKRLFKISISVCTVLLLGVQMNLFTSCNDDLPAESYYTFTGETMGDFLESREDFSLFHQIAQRAGQMNFLRSRGSRTFFPPVNKGVEEYLRETGYGSVDQIPAEVCDTLVKACLIDRSILYTYNFSQTVDNDNELDLPLIIITDGSVKDENGQVMSIINRRSAIINALKDDSVDNGVVHPVDRVLVPNTSLGSELLEVNHDEFEIFYEALKRTGLMDSLANYRDPDYDAELVSKYDEFHPQGSIWSGNFEYIAKRPDHRYQGFTLLIVPDAVLYEKYPEKFQESMTIDEKIEGLYELAVEKYGDDDAARNFGLNETEGESGKTRKELYWDIDKMESRYNPLNMFMSYHILDRLFESTEKLVNCWGVNENLANPTEWISTFLDFSTIKLEKVYNFTDKEVEHHQGFYVNHSTESESTGPRVRGAHLTVPANSDNLSLNVSYYYLDDVVAYDLTMRKNTMYTRIRLDFITLWPELTTNGIRLCGEPWQQVGDWDKSENGANAGGFNYYIPNGYMKNMEVSENAIFFVQRPKTDFWNWGGDEINILGTSYDVTFPLPNVPEGQYEVRLGYPGMADRGIAQIYVDGKAEGLPIDMRYRATDSRVGGLYPPESVHGFGANRRNVYSDEVLEENARTMKNNGYYSGPRSIYTYKGGNGQKHQVPTYIANEVQPMYDNPVTFRRKICTVNIKPQQKHTIRVRSVLSKADDGCFILDYLELVPIGICGAGGIGEDLN